MNKKIKVVIIFFISFLVIAILLICGYLFREQQINNTIAGRNKLCSGLSGAECYKNDKCTEMSVGDHRGSYNPSGEGGTFNSVPIFKCVGKTNYKK